MEYSVNKDMLAINETIFEGCQEQPVDLDFSLPDYCPDIQKVLKCCIVPKIYSKNISGDRLDIEGTAVVKLLYIDSIRSCVRCCENSIPFSASFSLGATVQNEMVEIKTKVEYINCRALSSRRLDIHGAFSVCAKVCAKEIREVGSSVDSDDIMQKKETVEIDNVLGMTEQQFSVEEKLELDKTDMRVDSIVRSSVSIIMDECKPLQDKLIVKGQAIIRILFVSDIESCELQTIEYSIPISQIIDIEGTNEQSICDANLNLLGYELKIDQEGLSDTSSFMIDMRLSASAVVYEESEIKLLTDAYSNTFETELTYSNVKLPKFVTKINENYVNKSTIEFQDKNISDIIDIWNDIATVNVTPKEDHLEFSGKINICVLAKNENDEIFYIERVVDFTHEHTLPEKISDPSCHADINVVSLSYRINGDNLEIRSDIKLSCSMYDIRHYKVIESIFVDEDKKREKDNSSALVIYYADKDENTWDIARKYCSSQEMIHEENDLTSENIVEPRMLLIPLLN